MPLNEQERRDILAQIGIGQENSAGADTQERLLDGIGLPDKFTPHEFLSLTGLNPSALTSYRNSVIVSGNYDRVSRKTTFSRTDLLRAAFVQMRKEIGNPDLRKIREEMDQSDWLENHGLSICDWIKARKDMIEERQRE